MTTVRIPALPGTAIAENKDQAREIRIGSILPALARGEDVVLDFAEVELATQSFVHALISDAINVHGEEALRLITFEHCSEELREIILTVTEYSLMAIAASGDDQQRGGEDRSG